VTDGLSLAGAGGIFHVDAQGLEEGRLTARVGAEGRLFARARRRSAGHDVEVRTTDAGALARLLDLSRSVRGGRGRMVGVLRLAGGRPRLQGKVLLRDFHVKESPGLSALASTSFGGIVDLIRGKGIHFDET